MLLKHHKQQSVYASVYVIRYFRLIMKIINRPKRPYPCAERIVPAATILLVDGCSIRAWIKMRKNRVLLVFADTGSGNPEEALVKVYERFCSKLHANDFGNNSRLGLVISKQIIDKG